MYLNIFTILPDFLLQLKIISTVPYEQKVGLQLEEDSSDCTEFEKVRMKLIKTFQLVHIPTCKTRNWDITGPLTTFLSSLETE